MGRKAAQVEDLSGIRGVKSSNDSLDNIVNVGKVATHFTLIGRARFLSFYNSFGEGSSRPYRVYPRAVDCEETKTMRGS